MSKDTKRIDRLTEMIQRKLSQIIQQEIKDPRFPRFVTFSGAKVSADLSHAKIYFTVFNADVIETANILNSAAPHLRSVLARSMKSRTVPQLHFVHDESIEYGRRLSQLIAKANPPDSADE